MGVHNNLSQSSESSDSDSIKVYVRVRPPASDMGSSLCLEVDRENKQIRMPYKPEPKVFTFDEVADTDTTQESVFAAVGRTVIDSCFDGYNGTIFAYGQTGSGKTFTMLGPASNAKNFQDTLRGVIPRSFEYLFNLINKERELKGESIQFLCKCSFLEIYNEQIFDLLDPGSIGLQIRENMKCGVFVQGLTEVAVNDASEAYECLSSGWCNRTVASTNMNRESSRSHAVFTIHLESKEYNGCMWNVRSSQLNLVDLAGSERQKLTKTEGARLKEGSVINQSLSTLGNVIMALVEIAHGKIRHIPYRNSKLSFLLKDSLGGNAKTYIIACIHPSSKCFEDTLSTLQFASRAKMIKNKAVINEDTHGSVAVLQTEIRKLKEMLAAYESGSIPKVPCTGSESISSDNEPHQEGDGQKYKEYFIKAMQFRQEEIAKNEALQEKYKNLQESLKREGQALGQTKLILKFREHALRQCEKSLKDNAAIPKDEKDEIISSLRKEVHYLEEQLNRYPKANQMWLNMSNMETELKKLKNERQNYKKMQEDQLAEMETMLQQLIKEKEKNMNTNRRQSITNTPKNVNESAVNSAMIERYKSQVNKLQEEVETLRQSLAMEQEKAQQTIVEKDSEIISLRKSKEELQKNLQARQIRYQIEREQMEDTMKTIMTPKKSKSFSNSILSDDGVDILQSVPFDLSEDRIETLTETVQKLQEELSFIRAQRDNLESQIVEQVEELSRIESQKNLTQEHYNKEKAVWTDKEKELSSQLADANNKLRALNEENSVLHGEVQDLRVMYNALEKRHKEALQKLNEFNEDKHKEVGQLETKQVQMEMKLKQTERQLQQLQEELTTLRQSEETSQATLDFTEEKLHQVEDDLLQARKENEDLRSQLALAENRLSQEMEKNHRLQDQLHQKGDQEKLLEALRELEQVQSESQVIKDMLSESTNQLSSVKQQLSEAKELIEELTASNTQKTEMISSLTSQLSAKNEQICEKEHHVELLSKQLEEYTQANTRLVSENESLAKEKDETLAIHAEEVMTLETEVNKLKLQIYLQQEDIEQIIQNKDEMVTSLNQLNDENNQLKTRNEEQQKTIEDLKEENDTLSNTITSVKKALESLMNQQNDLEKDQSEISLWQQKCEELEGRWNKLLHAFDTVSKQHEEQMETIRNLEEQLETKSKRIKELETVIEEVQAKCSQSDEEIESWRSKTQDLQMTLAKMKEDKAETEAMHVKAETLKLSEEIEQLKTEISKQNDEVTRLRYLLESKQKQSEWLQLKFEEVKAQNRVLEEELKCLSDKYQREADEKALLAGSQNQLNRIRYLEKINQERKDITQKYQQLLLDYEVLKKRLEVPRLDRNTPNKMDLKKI